MVSQLRLKIRGRSLESASFILPMDCSFVVRVAGALVNEAEAAATVVESDDGTVTVTLMFLTRREVVARIAEL